jgi:nicotinamidase-related amidase
MSQVLEAARDADIQVFYALHHRYRPGDYENWKYIAPIQKAAWSRRAFEVGTWGGELRSEFEPRPGDVVAQEHLCSSGFANTDLDVLLKRQGIHQLIMIGLIAHTCLEATVRFGAELGYEVTVVKDATASYSDVEMHAALGQHSQLRDCSSLDGRDPRRHLAVDRLTHAVGAASR